jgi:hypothetical protein
MPSGISALPSNAAVRRPMWCAAWRTSSSELERSVVPTTLSDRSRRSPSLASQDRSSPASLSPLFSRLRVHAQLVQAQSTSNSALVVRPRGAAAVHGVHVISACFDRARRTRLKIDSHDCSRYVGTCSVRLVLSASLTLQVFSTSARAAIHSPAWMHCAAYLRGLSARNLSGC